MIISADWRKKALAVIRSALKYAYENYEIAKAEVACRTV